MSVDKPRPDATITPAAGGRVVTRRRGAAIEVSIQLPPKFKSEEIVNLTKRLDDSERPIAGGADGDEE